MASMTTLKDGHVRIQFTLNGKRRTLKLGKMDSKHAGEVLRRVEAMLGCLNVGVPYDHHVARWLKEISDDLHKRVATVGLAEPRQATQLGPFLESYISTLRKSSTTIDLLRLAANRLGDHFGVDRDIRTITVGEAEQWEAELREGFAASTAGREIRRVKQFFAAAERRMLIDRSVFANIKGTGDADPERNAYIPAEDAQKVIASCPSVRWRLIFALARFAGLRVPSELATLTWAAILWDESVMMVKDGKKGTTRRVPIAAELRPHLDAAWDAAPEGAVTVFSDVTPESNLGTTMDKIVTAAGIPTWPKTFVNLRASCETDWMRRFPVHVVCAWMGNSPQVAIKHYARVVADDERAASEQAAKVNSRDGETRAAPSAER